MEFDEDDYLMLSGIQHYVFCKRQWALIHIEHQWAENYRTTSGELMHKRAHQDNLFELRGDILTAHNLKIFSRKLGISGQSDIVEFHREKSGVSLRDYPGNWSITPVEYKRGKPKLDMEDEYQLCLQAMCLEEMFLTHIKNGYLYYGEKRHRYQVEFSEQMREMVKKMLFDMHALYTRGYTPIVKMNKKCKECFLKDICLPKLMKNNDVEAYIKSALNEGE